MSADTVAGDSSTKSTSVVRRRPSKTSSPPSTSPPRKKRSRRRLTKPNLEKSAGQKSPDLSGNVEPPIQARSSLPKADLVMEDVRILKRASSPSSGSSTPCLTELLGPDPVHLPKPSGPAFAGPAFFLSPSPNLLPVPLFLKKAAAKGEDVATRGIRCLLLLESSLCA